MKFFLATLIATAVFGMQASAAGTLAVACHTILAPTAEPGDANDWVSIHDIALAPGVTGRTHSHAATEYLVVEHGTATVTIKGQSPKTVSAGSAMVIPPDAVHTVANASKTDGLDFIGFNDGRGKAVWKNLDKRKPSGNCAKM